MVAPASRVGLTPNANLLPSKVALPAGEDVADPATTGPSHRRVSPLTPCE